MFLHRSVTRFPVRNAMMSPPRAVDKCPNKIVIRSQRSFATRFQEWSRVSTLRLSVPPPMLKNVLQDMDIRLVFDSVVDFYEWIINILIQLMSCVSHIWSSITWNLKLRIYLYSWWIKIISYTCSDNTAVNCKDEWWMMMMVVDPTSFIISKHVIWMNANDVHNDTKIHNLKKKV